METSTLNSIKSTTPPPVLKQSEVTKVETNSTLLNATSNAQQSTSNLNDLSAITAKSDTSINLTKAEEEVLKKAEVSINESLLSNLNQKIGFTKDENTGKTIIVIKDKETDEVIKQIPPQHFLDLVYSLNKAASVVLKDLPRYA